MILVVLAMVMLSGCCMYWTRHVWVRVETSREQRNWDAKQCYQTDDPYTCMKDKGYHWETQDYLSDPLAGTMTVPIGKRN